MKIKKPGGHDSCGQWVSSPGSDAGEGGQYFEFSGVAFDVMES